MTAASGPRPADAWNPGIASVIPRELLPLCTIYRPENAQAPLATVNELHALTGFARSELVLFRPERLLLHELLIRVTADFAVPDGSRIGDLGINFREMAGRLLERHLAPQMPAIVAAYLAACARLRAAVEEALHGVVPGTAPAPTAAHGAAAAVGASATAPRSPARRLFAGWSRNRPPAVSARAAAPRAQDWGPREIAECERRANAAQDPVQRLACRSLARVMSALFNTHGQAWGGTELIVSLAANMAANIHGSDVIGRHIEPLLLEGAAALGYARLPRQEQPVVINTKGPSAAGKSTLRPLHKRLAGRIGVRWADFALISPDIWRKQLLDYDSLGAAYKYAGAFTAEELQIVDQKLDRYMVQKHARGEMTHLLIDRFRFDSFAPDSAEAGSNLLTRFGQRVYLFFVITPPAELVERAWKRGLEFGRFKAVDDTLAHSVVAYTGIPSLFFTWIRRRDKRIKFEFLDNSVSFGELPRTVACGDNETCNVLDVGGLLDIERYGRVNVEARAPQSLYPDAGCLDAANNLGFLRRCVEAFRRVNFAAQATGRIYLALESGQPVFVDRAALTAAIADADTLCGIRAVAPTALAEGPQAAVAAVTEARHLDDDRGPPETIGQWGGERGAR